MKERFRLHVKDHFDAAHFLKHYEGKCSRMHGHRWDVEVVIEGKTLSKYHMLIDFGVVKQLMKSLLNDLDHFVLNEQLKEEDVTAEYLAKWFYIKMGLALVSLADMPTGLGLAKVIIWESPDCCIEYGEED